MIGQLRKASLSPLAVSAASLGRVQPPDLFVRLIIDFLSPACMTEPLLCAGTLTAPKDGEVTGRVSPGAPGERRMIWGQTVPWRAGEHVHCRVWLPLSTSCSHTFRLGTSSASVGAECGGCGWGPPGPSVQLDSVNLQLLSSPGRSCWTLSLKLMLI